MKQLFILSLLLGSPIAQATEGSFCDGRQTIAWVCNAGVQDGMVDVGGGCYHRATGTACTNSAANPAPAPETNTSVTVNADATPANSGCDAGSEAATTTASGARARSTADVFAETGKCIPQSTINGQAGKVFWATAGITPGMSTAEMNRAMGWSGTEMHGLIPYGTGAASTRTQDANGAAFGGVATGSSAYGESATASSSATVRNSGAAFGGGTTMRPAAGSVGVFSDSKTEGTLSINGIRYSFVNIESSDCSANWVSENSKKINLTSTEAYRYGLSERYGMRYYGECVPRVSQSNNIEIATPITSSHVNIEAAASGD